MTLSRWLRDYVYIPLGGNRRGSIITYRNLMATMLLGGLWHGAAWTFVAWGGLHGIALSVSRWRQSAARVRPTPAVDLDDLAGTDPDVPVRRARVDLLPRRLLRARPRDAHRPLHALGRALAARHVRRDRRDRGRARVAARPGPRFPTC